MKATAKPPLFRVRKLLKKRVVKKKVRCNKKMKAGRVTYS